MVTELKLAAPVTKMMRLDERNEANMHSKYAIVDQEAKQLLAAIDFQNGDPAEVGLNGIQHEELLQIMVDRLTMCNLKDGWVKFQYDVLVNALHVLQKGK